MVSSADPTLAEVGRAFGGASDGEIYFRRAMNSPFLWIGLISIIAGAVSGYILLYQLWKLIPADISRTTPGKAVGFVFIPFFNFYWVFIAYYGLGEDMNTTLQRYGIPHRVSKGLGLTLCILAIVLWFVLFPFSLLAFFVASIIFFKSVKDGAIALLEQGGQ
jgi:hypothetical protein